MLVAFHICFIIIILLYIKILQSNPWVFTLHTIVDNKEEAAIVVYEGPPSIEGSNYQLKNERRNSNCHQEARQAYHFKYEIAK